MGVSQPSLTKYTTQYMQALGFDETYQQPAVEIVGLDSANSVLRRVQLDDNGTLFSTDPGTDRQLQIDYVGGTNPIYIAKAPQGVLTSSSGWLINKFTYDGNSNVTSRQTATGIYDNRASLTYT